MAELLDRIASLNQRAEKMREELPVTDDEQRESRVRSVYASLAIEDSSVTIEEVREVLSSNAS